MIRAIVGTVAVLAGFAVLERSVDASTGQAGSCTPTEAYALLPRGEVVIAFNNLHAARALLSRPRRTVIYCAVDFVPHRFGAGTLLMRVFQQVDRWVCGRVAARFELSQTGLDGRNETLGLVGKAARAAWITHQARRQ